MNNELSATVVFQYGVVRLSPRRWAVMRTASSGPNMWEAVYVLRDFGDAVAVRRHLECGEVIVERLMRVVRGEMVSLVSPSRARPR
jgi:hypothetical protein